MQKSCEASSSTDVATSASGTSLDLANCLQALQGMCTNVIARPEEASFRTIRLLNAHFQRTVARFPGGVECLIAMGFKEGESLGDEDAIFYVMDEPSLEDDYEGWASWYDGLSTSDDAARADGVAQRAPRAAGQQGNRLE